MKASYEGSTLCYKVNCHAPVFLIFILLLYPKLKSLPHMIVSYEASTLCFVVNCPYLPHTSVQKSQVSSIQHCAPHTTYGLASMLQIMKTHLFSLFSVVAHHLTYWGVVQNSQVSTILQLAAQIITVHPLHHQCNTFAVQGVVFGQNLVMSS